jgi:hypothetical protein
VNISDKVLKSVAFIGTKKGDKFLPRATAFIVQHTEDGQPFDHLVTAEHVIAGLRTSNQDIWLRANLANGGTKEIAVDPSKFRYHPNNASEATDVAISPFRPKFVDGNTGETIALETISLSLEGKEGFLPSIEFAKQSIVLGGEVAIVGLFRSHHGTNRNVPIVRVGNISAMPGEPVFTNYAGYIEAYLVEARSIAGLSGSPVFVLPDSTLVLTQLIAGEEQQGCALLGLMHGHFDVQNLNEDVVSDENEPRRSVHTGIGVVVPVTKILETIRCPDLVDMRKAAVASLREGAEPDWGFTPGT